MIGFEASKSSIPCGLPPFVGVMMKFEITKSGRAITLTPPDETRS